MTVAASAVALSRPTPGHVCGASGQSAGSIPSQKVAFELTDAGLHLNCLFGQGADHLGGESRDLVRLTGHCASHEPKGVRDTLGEIDAKLGKKPRDHVDELRALPNEEIARPVQRQRRLLLNRLDRHEAHGGRVTASQIASALPASVLPRFT